MIGACTTAIVPQVEVVQHDIGNEQESATFSVETQTPLFKPQSNLAFTSVQTPKTDVNPFVVTPVPNDVLIQLQSDWKVAEQQRSDSDLATVLSWVEAGHKPPFVEAQECITIR